MPDAYDELLDAAIQQLQDLKALGVRFVPLSPEGLAALNQAPRSRPALESRQTVGQASRLSPSSSPANQPTLKPIPAPPTAPIVPTPAPPPPPAIEVTRQIDPGKTAAFAELQ